MNRNRERSFWVSPITMKKPRSRVTCRCHSLSHVLAPTARSARRVWHGWPAPPPSVAWLRERMRQAAGIRSSKLSSHSEALTVLYISPPCAHTLEIHAVHGWRPRASSWPLSHASSPVEGKTFSFDGERAKAFHLQVRACVQPASPHRSPSPLRWT